MHLRWSASLVRNPGPGSRAVSEYPSIEEIGDSLGDADAITYSVEPDGSVSPSVQRVLDSQLWKNLPAVRAGAASLAADLSRMVTM